jgi:tetratricopeptide (TPR) repeat protein
MASLETGRLLAGRYLLQDRLGDGGHAEVWKARDERTGRYVALKFLHLRGGGAADALPVLRHEAHMAQRLDHPGVLKVHDPEQDGQFVFLPMEFAAGGDASWLRGAPWPRVLPVLLQTSRVLEHAHERGVVHRDLKARNVLFDALGRVRVSDFGTAARTGSSDAPAPGSPFSASPQQLRDEPATAADDVYGLGALAYELLTGYPPFYPNFDARRVQDEEPERPVPAHPVPEELLDLIQRMLSRDADQRPPLAEVVAAFESLLARGEAVSFEDVRLVSEAGPATSVDTRPAGSRRWLNRVAWAAGLAAVTAGVVVLVQLSPAKPPAASVTETLPATEAPLRVADAVVPESVSVAAPVAAPGSAQHSTTASVDELLSAGRSALGAMQPEQASAAFQHVLVLQPENSLARDGIAAASRLRDQLAGLAAGARLEAAGNLTGAADQYRLLVANDAAFAPAHTALARVAQGLRAQKLEDLLGAGADALRQGHMDVAQSAYRQAAEIDADNPRVLDGQQRIAQVLADRRNAEDLQQGIQLENAEKWDQAVAHYREVLARNAQLDFATDGLVRSERRAELDHELRDYLARPERLTAPAVQRAAERALARGAASAGNSPRLQQQLQQLRTALDELAVQVRVAITSDNSTRVSLAPFGELGRFSSRELDLLPGHYTVIGRRDGFRDVRYEIEITPGQSTAALSVRCTERI